MYHHIMTTRARDDFWLFLRVFAIRKNVTFFEFEWLRVTSWAFDGVAQRAKTSLP